MWCGVCVRVSVCVRVCECLCVVGVCDMVWGVCVCVSGFMCVYFWQGVWMCVCVYGCV